jgi:hypothetical protein
MLAQESGYQQTCQHGVTNFYDSLRISLTPDPTLHVCVRRDRNTFRLRTLFHCRNSMGISPPAGARSCELADAWRRRILDRRLTLPIGGTAVRDKRPEVIAAMTAAEILTALAAYRQGSAS